MTSEADRARLWIGLYPGISGRDTCKARMRVVAVAVEVGRAEAQDGGAVSEKAYVVYVIDPVDEYVEETVVTIGDRSADHEVMSYPSHHAPTALEVRVVYQ